MDPKDHAAMMKAIEGIEARINQFSEAATKQIEDNGKISTETKAGLEKFGIEQREFADRLLALEQKGLVIASPEKDDSWGTQFTKSDGYAAFVGGSLNRVRYEVKNTIVGADATVAPDRAAGVVPGAFQMLTLENFLPNVPTSSNAIEFTRELAFTNNAAETAEGAAKPETDITFQLATQPVSTVAHWIKISRQLASDNAALAAYVNTRMRYGVNLRVENQLISGDGVAPNISGMLTAGNFTAHGYLSGDIGATLPMVVLIRKIIADCWAAGYPADGIILNPVDWANIEIELLTTAAGQMLISYTDAGQPRLWGLPVIQSIGMTADNVIVGSFSMGVMVHNRQGVIVEMFEQDDTNVQQNLVTVRAERRLALATEVPAAIRAGDLTPPAA